MIATAWDSPSGTGPQEGPQPPELVGKLHIERLELAQKIEKLKTFISMDAKYKEVNYFHRKLLKEQLSTMARYEEILVERLTMLNINQNED